MLKIHRRRRRTGKTTEVIARMKEDEHLILIVPFYRMKKNLYPPELHTRILVAFSDLFEEQLVYYRNRYFLFDEGFMFESDQIAKMYYNFGKMGIKVEVYGSISENF